MLARRRGPATAADGCPTGRRRRGRRPTARRGRASPPGPARGELDVRGDPPGGLAARRPNRRRRCATSTSRATSPSSTSRTRDDPRRRNGGRPYRSAAKPRGGGQPRYGIVWRGPGSLRGRAAGSAAWRRATVTEAIRARQARLLARRSSVSSCGSSSMSCEVLRSHTDVRGRSLDRSFLRPRYVPVRNRSIARRGRAPPPTFDAESTSSSVHARAGLSRRAPASSCTGTPSTNVPTTLASPIAPAPRSNRSRSSTARSASLPTSIEPVSSSRWLT